MEDFNALKIQKAAMDEANFQREAARRGYVPATPIPPLDDEDFKSRLAGDLHAMMNEWFKTAVPYAKGMDFDQKAREVAGRILTFLGNKKWGWPPTPADPHPEWLKCEVCGKVDAAVREYDYTVGDGDVAQIAKHLDCTPADPQGAAAGLDLDEIEARANAATPGPWWARFYESLENAKLDGTFPWADKDVFPKEVACVWKGSERGFSGLPGLIEVKANDGTFIAHARQDIPALIAECRRLRAALASSQAPAAEGEIDGDTLLRLAGDLARAEKQYREVHDIRGEGHAQTGRAWDIMRHAGDRLRDLIHGRAPARKEGEA
jgi:hypothetical protein